VGLGAVELGEGVGGAEGEWTGVGEVFAEHNYHK